MAGHEPQAWEYRTEAELGEARLNEMGIAGWELVGVENGTFYLKRPRLSFRELVTLDQKRSYYALWNVAVGEEPAR